MNLAGKNAVITGAGNGVGAGLARRFIAEDARVVIADMDAAATENIVHELDCVGMSCDVTDERAIEKLAELATNAYGPIDIWVSNAGISGPPLPGELPGNDTWDAMWNLHVMAHVYAVRVVLPSMVDRGTGYLFQTVSKAALGSQPDKVAYAVTKRAALALGEWLAVHCRPRGVAVSCFCPGAMLTQMLLANGFPADSAAMQTAKSTDEVAEIVVRGMEREQFMIVTDDADLEPLSERFVDFDAWLNRIPRKLAP